jgi:ribonuclease R
MSSRLPSRSDVLRFLASDNRPFHAKEIASQFDVGEASYHALLALLDNLAFDGAVIARDGHKFKIGRQTGRGRGEEREGYLNVNPRGFGFVASVGASGDDVFVSKEAMGGAMHGDKVLVSVRARGVRGLEGEISRVLERNMKRVAGILRRRGRSAWLEPDDTRVRGPIPLPDDIDARAGEGNSGKDGDAAVVTITRYPELPDETPVGKLEAVLGTPGEIKVEVAKVLVVAQIEELHSERANEEALAYGEEVSADLLEGRVDLTDLPLPTIDPEDARDHDDAVWVERGDDGGYRAWIAIADVSTYVRPGTAIDDEALKRGCSVYLPDRAIPMLPRPLSSNLCSLLPDVVRLCLCAVIDLDSGGVVKKAELVRGFMKSQAKLTYGGVARALGFTEAPPRDPKADAFVEGLRVANELARILRSKRLKRGALDFDLPEAKVVLGEDGNPLDVQRRSQDPGMKKAYQLIEELMLLANETVAKWLVDRQIPTIFRVHAPPDEQKLARLTTMCEQLGIEFDLEAAQDPKKLSALLKQFAEHPNAQVLNMLLLRSMKQATYDVTNIGHFGLASKAYLHFTSPIRRYPDLVVHRTVHAELLGQRGHRAADAQAKLAEAALAASNAERKAMEVEREVVDLHRAVLMRGKLGERFEGTVTAVVGTGLFVALDAPFVDVLVRLEDLGGDRYEVDDEGMRVVAARSGEAILLGDRMMLEVIDVAILRRTVYGRRVSADDGDGHARRPRRAPLAKEAPRGKSADKRFRDATRKHQERTTKKAKGGSKGGAKKGPKGKKKGRR